MIKCLPSPKQQSNFELINELVRCLSSVGHDEQRTLKPEANRIGGDKAEKGQGYDLLLRIYYAYMELRIVKFKNREYFAHPCKFVPVFPDATSRYEAMQERQRLS